MMAGNRRSIYNSIFIVPVLAIAGLLSSIFMLPFWFPLTNGNQNKFLFPSLESLLLGATISAVLWGFGYVKKWTKSIGVIAIVVAAHWIEQLLDRSLPQQTLPCWDCPSTSLFVSEVAIRFFIVSSIVFVVVLNLVEPRPKLPLVLLSFLGSAMLGSLVIGICDAWALREHMQLVLNGEQPGILWQITMATFLGVAVWTAGFLSPPSYADSTP